MINTNRLCSCSLIFHRFVIACTMSVSVERFEKISGLEEAGKIVAHVWTLITSGKFGLIKSDIEF